MIKREGKTDTQIRIEETVTRGQGYLSLPKIYSVQTSITANDGNGLGDNSPNLYIKKPKSDC